MVVPPDANSCCSDEAVLDSICLGSGRFLRAVLVPALVAAGYHPAIVQTRGRSFLDWTLSLGANDGWDYEVDTVRHDGTTDTTRIRYWGAGTLGSTKGKQDVLERVCPNIQFMEEKPVVVGIGVTEAGLSSATTQAMQDLYDVLVALRETAANTECKTKISVINTDNVSQNGNKIQRFMMKLARDDARMQEFLAGTVSFHNTMVDRITSQRPGSNGLVPRAEPTPLKALVIEDLQSVLSAVFSDELLRKDFGVVIRSSPGQLDADIALKLRIANGTHTSIAHTMALTGRTMTDVLSKNEDETTKLQMKYLDSFYEHQIAPGISASTTFCASEEESKHVYEDWRQRLRHAHFGLSTFFITQNGAAKGGIRIGPTVRDLVCTNLSISCSTAYALAAILRFLTPTNSSNNNGIYRGWLDTKCGDTSSASTLTETVEYADGLSYNLSEGWYEFRCACKLVVENGRNEQPLPEALSTLTGGGNLASCDPTSCEPAIRAYLQTETGGNMSSIADSPSFQVLTKAIATLYAQMVAGDGMIQLLEGLDLEASCECLIDGPNGDLRVFRDGSRPLHYKPLSIPDDSNLMNFRIGPNNAHALTSIIVSEVASNKAIDLHTHLLPPSHGPALCLWGIDELLTYHYLVAEYFTIAPPSVTPENFYAQTKQAQANWIWKALFVERSPISEACRGVITTCVALGLGREIHNRDLDAIRDFYRTFRDRGLEGAEEFSRLVFAKAGIDYAIMTNIPFEPIEARHWRPTPKDFPSTFRSACRVDPLLAGDTRAVKNALAAAGYDQTLGGARAFLSDWCDTMQPEYLMASTPHDFVLPEESRGSAERVGSLRTMGVNEEAMKELFAFASLAAASTRDCGTQRASEDELPSIIDENSDFLTHVLMPICEERDLPIALKIGAHRQVNPSLQQAGDGVVAFADANVLARLCSRFPRVRFLATFLSRTNQHEACVLATKFRNLHLYGCWWFCNNPSIIREMTSMRIEMLGTSFTAQHSDSRVLDQLVYKWSHSRAVIASVLIKEYNKLIDTGGWSMTRGEIRRDVRRLFGQSYEEFMNKSLMNTTI